ncbi:hypothetical protein CCUS01_10491 [Colletotrichum cuscutae]|uniref:Uncharacterized protein n=1 Tax=Colletotrichum cuscutae TaxID=1209917 RepID=A0AAI9XLT2_9PEZI|nr:hypothetical protein CCUS01_10491 [Colletotrichum cuscutae]
MRFSSRQTPKWRPSTFTPSSCSFPLTRMSSGLNTSPRRQPRGCPFPRRPIASLRIVDRHRRNKFHLLDSLSAQVRYDSFSSYETWLKDLPRAFWNYLDPTQTPITRTWILFSEQNPSWAFPGCQDRVLSKIVSISFFFLSSRRGDNVNGHQRESGAMIKPYLWVSGGLTLGKQHTRSMAEKLIKICRAGLKPTGGGGSGYGPGDRLSWHHVQTKHLVITEIVLKHQHLLKQHKIPPSISLNLTRIRGNKLSNCLMLSPVSLIRVKSMVDITGFRPVGVWNTADHLNWGTPSTLRRISFRGPSIEIYDNVIAAFKGADDENIIDRTLIVGLEVQFDLGIRPRLRRG